MSRYLSWILCIFAGVELCANAASFGVAMNALTDLRRELLIDPAQARHDYCAAPNHVIKLDHRQQGQWLATCEGPIRSGSLARYWRLEARLKYGMLFLLDLPITVSIVIFS